MNTQERTIPQKINKSLYTHRGTIKEIEYTEQYIPQVIIESIILSGTSTLIEKNTTGAGATHNILSTTGHTILLIAPTVALIKDKEQQYNSTNSILNKNINIKFIYGGSEDRIANDFYGADIIMATPDQVVKMNFSRLQNHFIFLDETHFFNASGTYRSTFGMLVSLIQKHIASGRFSTITATPETYILPSFIDLDMIKLFKPITEFRTIYFDFIEHGEKKNKLTTSFYKKISSESSNNILYFSNITRKLVLIHNFFGNSSRFIVGNTIETKIKAKVDITELNPNSNIVLASSAGMEGIDINIDNADCFLEYASGDIEEYRWSNMVQAFGRIRGTLNSANVLIDNRMKHNTKPHTIDDDFAIIKKLNDEENNLIFSGWNELKKHKKTFEQKGYKIELMSAPDSNILVGKKKGDGIENIKHILTHYDNHIDLYNDIKYGIANNIIDSNGDGSFSFSLLREFVTAWFILNQPSLKYILKNKNITRVYSELKDILIGNNIIPGAITTTKTIVKQNKYTLEIGNFFYIVDYYGNNVNTLTVSLFMNTVEEIKKYNEKVEKHRNKSKIKNDDTEEETENKYWHELSDLELTSAYNRTIRAIKNIYISYMKGFSARTVIKKDYRDYSSITTLSIKMINHFFCKSFIEIDITAANPSFIDKLIGSKKAGTIYEEIADKENITRTEAKIRYNTILNLNSVGGRLQSKRNFFGKYYTLNQAMDIISKTHENGDMFLAMTEIEKEYINILKSRIIGGEYKIDTMVRRHDSLLVFGRNQDLLELADDFHNYKIDTIKVHSNKYMMAENTLNDYDYTTLENTIFDNSELNNDIKIFIDAFYGSKKNLKTKVMMIRKEKSKLIRAFYKINRYENERKIFKQIVGEICKIKITKKQFRNSEFFIDDEYEKCF